MATRSFDELAVGIDADPARSGRAEAYGREVEAQIFACELAELRRSLGVNQVEVAEKLGITQGGVSRLERSADPKLSTLCKLTSAMGGTLFIEIDVGGRKVSFSHPPPGPGAPCRVESGDPAPPASASA